MSRPWRATYRLQLGPELDFDGARALVPYLQELGVSHLYLSPSMRAFPGSTHGYDVVDPTRISEELGGAQAFRRLCSAGLGVLLDVVPNHMAATDENRFWADEDARARYFDWDPESGWYRRFFTIADLAGVRVEDEGVFAETHSTVLSLLDEGFVDGLRIDHPDGLADPAGYLAQLRERGVEHVWVEKILEPGEELRPWPVEGTTGYEFANDATALFVDPAGEEPLTQLYQELTGERRTFAEVAYQAKLEQARTEFGQEFDRLRAIHDLPGLEEAAASLHVYRTYVEPLTETVTLEDRAALAHLDPELQRRLLLEEPVDPEFVVRFQQVTGPVMAKGVEDTAFYRWLRLTALNEVGGDPSRFSLSVEDFHRANQARAARFPRHLLATQTHDTKRSGDVRARIAALAGMAEDWSERARAWQYLDDPNENYLLLQSALGAWPLEEGRLASYLEKAAREAGVTTSWIDPDEGHERRLREGVARFYEQRPAGWDEFAARVAAEGDRAALAQTLLKLTVPGLPDIYQGDELPSLNLVDPDNRRPVDWEGRRRALHCPPPKLRVIREALALRARRPDAFGGAYVALDAGPDVCAFLRGDQEVLVAVELRRGGAGNGLPVPAGSWHDLLAGRELRLRGDERLGDVAAGAPLLLLERA